MPKTLKGYVKQSGKAFQKSPLSKAKVSDVKDVRKRGDYGIRKSKNVEDFSGSHESAKYKRANNLGRMADKALHENSVTESKRLKNVSPSQNTRNTNIRVNNMRDKYPDIVGSRLKNVKLDSKPGTFRKKKK